MLDAQEAFQTRSDAFLRDTGSTLYLLKRSRRTLYYPEFFWLDTLPTSISQSTFKHTFQALRTQSPPLSSHPSSSKLLSIREGKSRQCHPRQFLQQHWPSRLLLDSKQSPLHLLLFPRLLHFLTH